MLYIPGAIADSRTNRNRAALLSFDARIVAEVHMTHLKFSENLREFHSMFPSVAGTLKLNCTRQGAELSRTGRVKARAIIQSMSRDELERFSLLLVERTVTNEWLMKKAIDFLASAEGKAKYVTASIARLVDDFQRLVELIGGKKIKFDSNQLPRISTRWLFRLVSDNTDNLDFYRGRILRALKHRTSAER